LNFKVLIFIVVTIFLFPCLSNAKISGTLSLGGLYQSIDVVSKSTAFNLSITRGELAIGASLDYGKTANLVTTNKGDVYVGYDPVFNNDWSLWFLGQVGYNKVAGIRLENSIGGGPKYTFWREGKDKASASFGWLMYSRSTEEDSKHFNRLSLRLKGTREYKHVQLSGIGFYQPAVHDFDDFIVLVEVKATIPLVDKIGLSFGLEDEYRSVTKAEEKNSLLGKVSLEVKF